MLLVAAILAITLVIGALTAAVGWLADGPPMQGRAAAEPLEQAVETPRRQSPGEAAEAPPSGESPESMLGEPIRWRRSAAVGLPYAGRLVRGVQLPSEGEDFFTWDPILKRTPNRGWRRHGTDRLVRVLLRVLRDFRAAHPKAPRVGIGDLSRPRGGDFGPRFGLPGHASHQNGLDVDVYYPRLDRRERGPARVTQVDRELAQDLVDRFVRAGARYVFVGPRVGLRGPRRVVQALSHHDNHLHVRLRPR
jgi:murein endopeptidase